MIQTTVQVSGMACSMCEAHVNDAVRREFPKVKKVTSSHGKGETVVISPEKLDQEALKKAVEATGYQVLSVSTEPYEKKGFFSFGK